MSKSHSKAQVTAYRKLLEKCDAPESLIVDFLDLVEIDNGIASEAGDLESLDRLLLSICVRYDFARPFDKKDKNAFFRPKLIDHNNPGYESDTGGWGEQFDPKAEQAYRRGYAQGFAHARQMIEAGDSSKLRYRESEIRSWRLSKVIFGPTFPGNIEPFGIKVTTRSSLPARLRYDVLERDEAKCKMCGRSAADGVVLHVDHIVPVAKGGTDEIKNLQTLCEECNLGKGAR